MDEKVKVKPNSDGILQDYVTIQLNYVDPKALNQSSMETVELKAEIDESDELVLVKLCVLKITMNLKNTTQLLYHLLHLLR